MSALAAWSALVEQINGRVSPGQPGVRDPENTCEAFDGLGYDGRGSCKSDGHYLCAECSLLSPEASRFTERDDGRRDRLRLFWARPGAAARQPHAPDCAAKILVGANGRPPPSWFLDGRAPPRWSLKRLPEGRVDLCPAHRPRRGEP